MKTINSLSGGKTSSYIAANYPADYDIFSLVRIEDETCKFKDKKIIQEVEDRIQAPFIATAEEDVIIYTMLDLEQYIGRPITWVTGPTFEEIVQKRGQYLPNKIARYCTTEMKTFPIAQWRHKNIEGDVEMRFGFRANEMRRADRMIKKLNDNGMTEVKIIVGRTKNGRQNKWKTIEYCKPTFPLIEDLIYKDTIEKFWEDKPVRFAYMNNCVGCWWRTPPLLKLMHEKQKEKMEFFAKLERESKGTFQTGITYDKIIDWKPQVKLSEDGFDECDSGYCGL